MTPGDVIGGSAEWCVRVGDSLRLIDELPPDSVDLIVTDPPYSSGGQTRCLRSGSPARKYTSRTGALDFEGDSRDQRAFARWCSMWFSDALRATRPGGSAIVFIDWRQIPAISDAIQIAGWVWRGMVPWDKGPATRPRHGAFRSQCEYILWATRGPFGPWGDDAPYLNGLFSCPAPKARHHITEKPVPLLRELVKMAPPGGVVLDPFAGSGTTGEAAVLEGRRAIMFEIGEHNAGIIRDRMAAVESGASLAALRAGQGALFGVAQ